jgi:hypothetical protein
MKPSFFIRHKELSQSSQFASSFMYLVLSFAYFVVKYRPDFTFN